MISRIKDCLVGLAGQDILNQIFARYNGRTIRKNMIPKAQASLESLLGQKLVVELIDLSGKSPKLTVTIECAQLRAIPYEPKKLCREMILAVRDRRGRLIHICYYNPNLPCSRAIVMEEPKRYLQGQSWVLAQAVSPRFGALLLAAELDQS